uniref:PEP-CTERM sorting domain-containing protein n=1 Tax=Aquabacterium sp. TaxID=1872578 RepID=UPI0037849829
PSLIPPSGSFHYQPGAVVTAWSSFAWDSTRHDLLLWGGGHASHSGNEMYIWDGSTGAWTRGSLPSKVLPATAAGQPNLIIDNAAPQASHTYNSNQYLPINDRFITFGGPAYNDARGFSVLDGSGNIVRAGPWMYDPSKADPTKVGGTNGSGWNPATQGGNMWQNRAPMATGAAPGYFINNTAEYHQENGHDVVYITDYNGGGGWPNLYRYIVANPGTSETDRWELVGVTSYAHNAASFQAAGTIDNAHNLYVHTVSCYTCSAYDLNVWDITKSGVGNAAVDIQLVGPQGQAFTMDQTYSVQYSDRDGGLYLYNGDQGKVYRTQVAFNPDGSLKTVWEVDLLGSVTAAHPKGNYVYGVVGKWQYVDELGALVALDEMSNGDASVWLYKIADLSAPVPEPGVWAMLLAGLGLMGLRLKRLRP